MAGGGDVERAAQPAIAEVGRIERRGVNRLAGGVRGRQLGDTQERRQPRVQIRVGEHLRSEDRRRGLGGRRQHHRRGLAHAGGRVRERLHRGAPAFAGRAGDGAEPVQRPQRVERRAVGADGVDFGIRGERDELRHDVERAALDQQPLRVQPPQHVVALQRGHQAGRIRLRQRRSLRRRRRVAIDDAVDAAARLVAHRRLVGVARPVAVSGRRRVVLVDERVPVGDPDRAVRPDLGVHRREPFLGAGDQVPAVAGDEAATLRFHDALADEMRGRLGDERDAVPVLLRERPRRVELMPGRGGVAAPHVDLADVGRQEVGGVELRRALVAGPADRAHAGGELGHGVEEAVGDGDVEAGIVVGGRAEHVAGFAEAEAPGVVGRSGDVLELRAVRLEAVDTLAELHRRAVHLAVEARIADHAPDEVVEPVLQVGRTGVRVAGCPSRC